MNTNKNPPAFPPAHPSLCVRDAEGASELLGMTLRDYFAGHYLAGVCADPGWSKTAEETAALAYEQADAMLAARAMKEGA